MHIACLETPWCGITYIYIRIVFMYIFFYFVIIETINTECTACAWLGTQLVFYDLSQQAPECISVPVLNGLNPNILTLNTVKAVVWFIACMLVAAEQTL